MQALVLYSIAPCRDHCRYSLQHVSGMFFAFLTLSGLFHGSLNHVLFFLLPEPVNLWRSRTRLRQHLNIIGAGSLKRYSELCGKVTYCT